MKQYLIIGNGIAGTSAAQSIRKYDQNGKIDIVTQEEFPFYARIRLPDYIAEVIDVKKLILHQDKWYYDNDINIRTQTKIIDIDYHKKKAKDQKGNIFGYNSLLIATGSKPFFPFIPGNDKKNIFVLRNIGDANNIMSAARKAKRIIIVGGGLLGLETAYALIRKSYSIVVLELIDRLLPRQIDKQGSALIMNLLEKKGFKFKLNAKVRKIIGHDFVKGLELDSGEIVDGDMIIISAGVRANLDIPLKLKLKTKRGTIVNSKMQTSINDIYAAGDVAQIEETHLCLWSIADKQGEIAGANMAGYSQDYEGAIPLNHLSIAGIKLSSAGNIDVENLLDNDIKMREQIYQKFVRKEGKLVGCIMINDTIGFTDIAKKIAGKK